MIDEKEMALKRVLDRLVKQVQEQMKLNEEKNQEQKDYEQGIAESYQ